MFDGKGINHGTRNIFHNCGTDFVSKAAVGLYSNISVPGKSTDADITKTSEVRIEQNSPAVTATGFRPIPIDRIGRYEDPWRSR
jgi:hypothetical protein